MRRFFILALTLAPFAAPFAANADEPVFELPETIVTGTRTTADPAALPVSVSVITADQIKARGWQTLPQALASLPGLSVVQSGPIGAQTSVFMRGAESDHVLVLLDGMPLNDASTPTGVFNFGDTILADLDRIEVLRGPGSALYGGNAIGGVINLITASRPAGFTAEGAIAGGNHGTLAANARAGGVVGTFDYRLALGGLTTGGTDITPARLAGHTGDRDGSDLYSGSGNFGLQLSPDTRLEAGFRWSENRADLDDVPSDDPNSQARNRALNLRLAGETRLNAMLTTKLTLGYGRTIRGFDNAPDTVSVSAISDNFTSDRLRLDWANTLTLADNQTLVLGAEFLRDSAALNVNEVSAFGPFTQALDANAKNLALYGEWQGQFEPGLDLNLGLRWDRPDDYDSQPSVRAGAVWHLAQAARVHVSAGTGYKPPSLYDRYGVDNFGYVGNPNLKPEKSFGWEAGVDGTLDLFTRADAITWGATVYQTRVDDLIDYDFALSTTVNRDRARMQGLELSATVQPLDTLSFVAHYSFTDAIDLSTGSPLARRPRHSGGLSADWAPIPALHLRPAVDYIGSRDDVTYDNTGAFLGTNRVGGYLRADLAADYAVTDTASVFVSARNLLDRRIEDPNGFDQSGRRVLAGVRLTW